MTAIPGLTATNVRNALARIDQDGVPAGRGSTKFCLVVGGNHYPPKYVVALAARAALGRDLRPDEFSGGPQTNSVLEGLGFSVAACKCGGTRATNAKNGAPSKPTRKSQVTDDRDVLIVRLVSRGRTSDDTRAEERMLLDLFGSRWPEGLHAKFVLTPGGFVHGRWPNTWFGTSGWESTKSDIAPLVGEAERQLGRVLTDKVYRAAAGKTDVLTLGIDLFDDDAPQHVELVAVVDISKRKIVRWTGKSYPTSNQERTLVHVADLDTHLLEVADERVLVLGCHDLNMFSPRGHANQSPDGLRRGRCDEMKRRVARFKPTVVLQHPHSTDTPNIWRMPWLSLARDAPSIKAWASGIAYYSWGGKVRSKLDRVLDMTKSDPTSVVDVVLDARAYG
jgi:hypothetical protein